jgi:zinc-ribbon domain
LGCERVTDGGIWYDGRRMSHCLVMVVAVREGFALGGIEAMPRRRRDEEMTTPAQVCLRCGAPYEDGATVCFSCGAPIGEIKTPTQPVAVPRLPKRLEPLPDEAAGRPAAAAVSQPIPPPPLPRRARWWPVVLLALVLALAAGGGVAYVVRALTASPPVASSQVYRDSAHRFHFTRPALWTLTPRSTGVLLTDSDGINSMTLTITTPSPGEDAKAAADAQATSQKLTVAPPQQFAGATWEVRNGVHTDSDGVTRQTTLYVTMHDGDLYTIACVSPLASYNATNNLVYQPLLASFAFG